MTLNNLFKFRFFFIILIFAGISFVQMLVDNVNYKGFFTWIISEFPERQIELVMDFFWIYYSLSIGFSLMRKWYHERKSRNLVYIKATMPRADSKADEEKRTHKDFKEVMGVMSQFYRSMYEISDLNWWHSVLSKIWDDNKISCELVMINRQLQFYIVCDEYYQSIVEKQLTALYSSVEVETSRKGYQFKKEGYFINGYSMFTEKEDYYPVKMFKEMEEDPLNDITNVFSKIEEDETAAIQIIINPIGEEWRKEAERVSSLLFKEKEIDTFPKILDIPILGIVFRFIGALFTGSTDILKSGDKKDSGGIVRMLQAKEDSIKRMGLKSGQEPFNAYIRIMVCAKTQARVEGLLNDILVSFTVFRDAYSNWFDYKRIFPIDRINGWLMFHGFHRRLGQVYFGKSSVLVPDELATLYHMPDSKYNRSSTIEWLKYKKLQPPKNLPTEGVLMGYNTYRGIPTPVYIAPYDRSRHMYVLGKSGSGKSVLLSYMARQDAKNGTGFGIIDPHGDLIEDILRYIPKERARDVVVFNPADTDRPMGLNILEAKTAEQKDRAALDAMQIFIKMFGNEIFGPRIQHYFRNACLTLMDDEEEGATILDIPRMFIDEAFQKYKVAKCKNTVVRQFWEGEIANTGDREKQEMIPYFTSKFGPFISNTTIRNIIGQPKSAFNVRDVMDEGKILLINLSKGLIGDTNAQLLGLILVNKVSMAAMSRADIPEADRVPFFLYVDEFQNFATDAFGDILSEARKYKLALVMAHQYIAQLNQGKMGGGETKLKEAIFGNVGTMITFKMGAEDAEYFEKEYAPVLSNQDILSIANYKAYLKLSIGNAPSRPFSMGTIWDQTGSSQEIADILKEYSRARYGRKVEFVNEEIEARLGIVE